MKKDRLAKSVDILGTVSTGNAADHVVLVETSGRNTSSMSLSRQQRRLVQNTLTYWQPVELA